MRLKSLLALSLLLFVVGCASVATPFLKLRPDYSMVPEAELRAFAVAVERAALAGEREPDLGSYDGLATDTPELTQIIRTRAARSALVQELLTSGNAYEQRSGTIAILHSREYKRSTTRQKRDHDALLVMSENANRWALYEGLVKASQFSPRALAAVQNAFFEARRDIMPPGQRYQDESGSVVVK